MKTWVFFVAVVLILGCSVAGCVQPSQQEAEAQLCQGLAELGAALQNMDNLTVSSSVGDIRDAQAQVQSAMENVRSSASQLANIRIDDLNAAYENLAQTVQSLPDDANVVEAVQTLRPQVQAVREQQQNLVAELNCTAQGGTTG